MSTVAAWLAAHPELDRRDREVLLCRAAGLRRAQLITNGERQLDSAVAATLGEWAARRRRGEPVAYIIGEREFWGIELAVSPAVLVPRPETELLVEAGIQLLARHHEDGSPRLRVLDLGTGSGAVAIALAVEAAARDLPVSVTASDVSTEALAVAAANAARHGVHVTWLESDWFSAVTESYELIVSNPPYVAEGDPHLHQLRHEPRRALVGGDDGLAAIRTIVTAAPAHLRPGGTLLIEHGHDQGALVRELCHGAGFTDTDTLRDLAGLERVTRARRLEAICP